MAETQERVRTQLVRFSPFLLVVALSPVLLQTGTPLSCSGDSRLAVLELEVDGVNELVFDSDQRFYTLSLPAISSNTALVRAFPVEPGARVSVIVQSDSSSFQGMELEPGGGEDVVPLASGLNSLRVLVVASGGASGLYNVSIQVGCTDCDDGNECTTDACDAVLEMCTHTPVADGLACDADGLPGTCAAGVCQEECPSLTKVTVVPLQANVGDEIAVSAEASDAQGDMIDYLWSGSGGVFADPSAASTTYACLEIGQHDINIAVSDDGFTSCIAEWTLTIECLPM